MKNQSIDCVKRGHDKVICRFDELPNAILKEFLEKEADKIQGEIFYEHEVIKVEQLDNGVRVTTGNGKDFTTDSLICTFSVGILMHKAVLKFLGNSFLKRNGMSLKS